jgi:hypothetical protein
MHKKIKILLVSVILTAILLILYFSTPDRIESIYPLPPIPYSPENELNSMRKLVRNGFIQGCIFGSVAGGNIPIILVTGTTYSIVVPFLNRVIG